MDNCKQFDCATFRNFSTQLGTNLCFAAVYHPRSNGAVERTNGIIFAGIKKNITELPKGKWVDELLLSVETHRRVATGNTKSREVAGALAGTAPSSTARNSVTRPEVLWKTERAT